MRDESGAARSYPPRHPKKKGPRRTRPRELHDRSALPRSRYAGPVQEGSAPSRDQVHRGAHLPSLVVVRVAGDAQHRFARRIEPQGAQHPHSAFVRVEIRAQGVGKTEQQGLRRSLASPVPKETALLKVDSPKLSIDTPQVETWGER